MNQKAVSIPTYLLAVATVAVLAIGAVALSALFAHASSGPNVTVTATNGSNAVVTSASIGTAITAGAVVASSTSAIVPTGTVNFSTFNNLTCSGSPTVQSGVALTKGMASSSATNMSASGLSYVVNYNGDANNVPSQSSCASVTPTSQVIVITPSLSATSVNAGSSITAGASLSGATASATGTVSYTFYTTNICTIATTSPASVSVTNGSVPASAAVTFNQPGTYYLQEVYSGDQFNAATTSTCGSAVLTVNAINSGKNNTSVSESLSSTSIMTGTSVNASSVLSGETASAGGTVTYTAYTNNICTTGATGAGSFTVTNGAVPNSNSLQFNTAGNYFWQAVYSGDANNNGSTSSCNQLTVNTPNTGGTGATGTIGGTVYNDTNHNRTLDAGEAGIAGVTIQLSVLQNNWWLNVMHMQKYTEVTTTVTDANGNYLFNNLAAGVYYVQEIKKAGVNQISNDFRPVPLGSGAGDTGLNFANTIKSATSTNSGKGHDKDNDGNDDGDDNVASTTFNGNNGWNSKGISHGLIQKIAPIIKADVKADVKTDLENHKGKGDN